VAVNYVSAHRAPILGYNVLVGVSSLASARRRWDVGEVPTGLAHSSRRSSYRIKPSEDRASSGAFDP